MVLTVLRSTDNGEDDSEDNGEDYGVDCCWAIRSEQNKHLVWDEDDDVDDGTDNGEDDSEGN
eukprot:13293785-Ditylum_brightwellii.AAC.1